MRIQCALLCACASFLTWFSFENFLNMVERQDFMAGAAFLFILTISFVLSVWLLFAAVDPLPLED